MDVFIAFHGICLIGFVILQRGFAYLGVAPIYIGEIGLLIGLGVFLRTAGTRMIFRGWTSTMLGLFMVWGLMQTIPYIPIYGMYAIRDANLWWYGLWAYVIGGLLLARPLALEWIVRNYAKFAIIVLVGALMAFLLRATIQAKIPFFPGSPVQIIDIRPNNTMVHVAAIVAYLVAGLGGEIHWGWTLLVPIHLVAGGTASRGGLAAFIAALGAAMLMRPGSRWGWGLISSMVLAVGIFILLDLRIQGFWYRDISAETLISSIESLMGKSTNNWSEDTTKEWRLDWWRDIYQYTFQGRYGWTGKGFGVNLAIDDNRMVDPDLRSPHNGHLNVLARMGIPGLSLWALLNGLWVFNMIDGWFRARRAGDWKWAGFFIFLLAYWIAIQVNAAFDVYLEGPMGGIWLWTVIGVGMAAARLHKELPQVLYIDELLALRGLALQPQRQPAAGSQGVRFA